MCIHGEGGGGALFNQDIFLLMGRRAYVVHWGKNGLVSFKLRGLLTDILWYTDLYKLHVQ